MRKLICVCAVLLFVACGKKSDDKKAEPGNVTPKVVEPKKEPVKEPAADITVTSKSPEAIAVFEKGRDLVDNARGAESLEHFKAALAADPEFAQALAYQGLQTPGGDGTDMLHKAGTLSAKLPEAEKEWISAAQAMRAGDSPKAIAALEKVLQLAPGAWRADLLLGNLANTTSSPETAIKRFEHALSIKPDLAIAYNGLAYGNAGLRKWDAAIAAAKKQTELLPNQPNPQDTLAEIYLWSGKYEEAEKTFLRALEIEPKFNFAWQGVALSRAYRGDFKGAYEATDKATTSPDPASQWDAALEASWFSLAEGKAPQALTYLDKIEKSADAKKLPVYAFAALVRAHQFAVTGKHADATKWFATALTRADQLSGDGRNELKRGHAIGVLRNAALSGKAAADADKLVASIEEAAKASPGEVQLQSIVGWAHGLRAWAKTGAKDAVGELSKCHRDLAFCHYDLMLAQRKAGDTAGADATAKAILEVSRRDAAAVHIAVQAKAKK